MKILALALKELAKDIKDGGKKLKIILIILVIPLVLVYCMFSYYSNWFLNMFDADVELCLQNAFVRNYVYAFVEQIDELELDTSEKFIKEYFMNGSECVVPEAKDIDKIKEKYNLTDKQMSDIKSFVESNNLYNEYLSVGKNGYVSSVNYVTSCFGFRWGTSHKGIDISGPGNPAIFAYDKGEVVQSSYNSDFGYYVIIKHSPELTTRYFHLYEPGVQPGTKVSKSQQIGVMGTTGDSTGTHLHFELMVNGKQIDPYPYLITTGTKC